MSGERIARAFHETYERLAPQFGYKTRRESAVPWEDVLDANKRLMIAVAEELFPGDDLRLSPEQVAQVREALMAADCDRLRHFGVSVHEPKACRKCAALALLDAPKEEHDG